METEHKAAASASIQLPFNFSSRSGETPTPTGSGELPLHGLRIHDPAEAVVEASQPW